ncbi:HNH endonuclease [Alteribacillus iranensis]|uniref:HNH endonuclease n=1 Tax=Alteribacillus iranensis TaxID=930128 RepID=A0A1I1ZIC2_9BACI|nr:HNH endonuclease [Alteribacillus iranensis]SFE31447.1 HNH endonuclease [Alteribacillus iranensis]
MEKKTEYYILTVKLEKNNYKLIILQDGLVIDESHQHGLTVAKYAALGKLYKHDSTALNVNKVCMVHYKEDRPSGKPWHKDDRNELQGYINTYLNEETINFPALIPGKRKREFELYDMDIHSKVVFEYLFNKRSHRWLDENVINISPEYSRGFQSMGILHYIGLRDTHRGIFNGISIEEAINILLPNKDRNIQYIVKTLSYSIELAYVQRYEEGGKESEEYPEGKEAYRIHRFRERNSKVTTEAKKAFKDKYGELFCEACGFNFEKIYGGRGKDFIEAHHTKPVSEMKEGEKTKIEDITLLCSNCHRMVHRSPSISIKELKKKLG